MDVAIGPEPLEETLKRVPCVGRSWVACHFPYASWYHILLESLGLLASLFLGASDPLRVTVKSGRGLHLCEIWTIPEREDREPSSRASVSGHLKRSLVLSLRTQPSGRVPRGTGGSDSMHYHTYTGRTVMDSTPQGLA